MHKNTTTTIRVVTTADDGPYSEILMVSSDMPDLDIEEIDRRLRVKGTRNWKTTPLEVRTWTFFNN